MGSYDFVHLELSGFAGLHGWRVMIPFIWNFPVLQGCMGGGGHDTVHLEFSGVYFSRICGIATLTFVPALFQAS